MPEYTHMYTFIIQIKCKQKEKKPQRLMGKTNPVCVHSGFSQCISVANFQPLNATNGKRTIEYGRNRHESSYIHVIQGSTYAVYDYPQMDIRIFFLAGKLFDPLKLVQPSCMTECVYFFLLFIHSLVTIAICIDRGTQTQNSPISSKSS